MHLSDNSEKVSSEGGKSIDASFFDSVLFLHKDLFSETQTPFSILSLPGRSLSFDFFFFFFFSLIELLCRHIELSSTSISLPLCFDVFLAFFTLTSSTLQSLMMFSSWHVFCFPGSFWSDGLTNDDITSRCCRLLRLERAEAASNWFSWAATRASLPLRVRPWRAPLWFNRKGHDNAICEDINWYGQRRIIFRARSSRYYSAR